MPAKARRRLISKDSLVPTATRPAPRTTKARRATRGAERVFPAEWKRQAYVLHPDVAWALGILARTEGVGISFLVNRVLASEVLKRRGELKWGARQEPRNVDSLMPPGQPK